MVTDNSEFIGTSWSRVADRDAADTHRYRPVLVVINAWTDPIGLLGPPLVDAGLTLVCCDATADRIPQEPDDYAAVVVMGSGVNPDDDDKHEFLRAERLLLRACVDCGTPTIAVCLGAQLLAQALGASARRMPRPRIGWFEQTATHDVAADPLRSAWPPSLRALEWHSYSFALPPATTLLAGTAQSVQAFRAGACAWGFQYHLEADGLLAGHWLTVYRDDLGPSVDARVVTDVGRRTEADRGEHGVAVGRAFSDVVVAREMQVAR
jgi:GMP synthase-like glutamine amidotransferase